MAVLVVSFVCVVCAGLLGVNNSLTSRQASVVESRRAFYVAEAGLAEGLHGLAIGRSGQIGSEAAPARFGDGLFWVEATETADGFTRLESTGLCGSGRATLAATYERVETPLGFFADEGIELDAPLLMDGFSSDSGTYMEQAGLGSLTLDPSDPPIYIDEQYNFIFFQEGVYRFTSSSESTYTVDAYWLREAYSTSFEEVVAHFEAIPAGSGEGLSEAERLSPPEATVATGGTVSSSGSVTTGGGATLGSNGAISLAGGGGTVEIYGDVIPGADAELTLGAGVTVTGETQPRDEAVVLSEVDVPNVALQPAMVHDGLVPMIVSSGTVGYTSLEVAADSELIVRGPCTLVIDQLRLASGAQMTLDTTDGDVQLFVTGELDLEPGSLLETPDQCSQGRCDSGRERRTQRALERLESVLRVHLRPQRRGRRGIRLRDLRVARLASVHSGAWHAAALRQRGDGRRQLDAQVRLPGASWRSPRRSGSLRSAPSSCWGWIATPSTVRRTLTTSRGSSSRLRTWTTAEPSSTTSGPRRTSTGPR